MQRVPVHAEALCRLHLDVIALLHDLADRAAIDLVTLDAFLTGMRPLGSDVIDRLTKILRLKLKADGGKAKQRTARAG